MGEHKMKKTVSLLLGISLVTVSHAGLINQEKPVKHMADIIPFADKLADTYGKDKLCIVYDIDNTLITNKGRFASESWVYWQASQGNSYAKKLLGDNHANIYDFIDAIRYFINYQPVEKDSAEIISKLQDTYPSIALTSRGFSSIATTTRQLQYNHFDFSKNPIGDGSFDNSYLHLNKYKNGYSMYINGIQFAAGGDKGKLLQTLILKERAKTDNPNLCQAIVYVDDTKSKADMIKRELKGKFAYYSLHYTYLPDPEDKANWQPNNWKKASGEITNLVNTLNG